MKNTIFLLLAVCFAFGCKRKTVCSVPVGKVVAIKHIPGGFMNPSSSTIETTKGVFSASGHISGCIGIDAFYELDSRGTAWLCFGKRCRAIWRAGLCSQECE